MLRRGPGQGPAAKVRLGLVLLAGGLIALWSVKGRTDDKRPQAPASSAAPHKGQDEKALHVCAAAYIKAFNAGDAKKISTAWTPDGDFLDASGKLLRGRQAIEKDFASFFAENPGVKLELQCEQIRFPAPGVAIEDGVAHLRSAAGETLGSSRFTITHVQRNGQWLMACVREAPYQPECNDEHLRDLEWLIGTWTAKSGSRTVALTSEWTANMNFISRKYTVKEGNKVFKKGLQIIGWDPTAGNIRAWVFDGDGGFGEETWGFDSKTWVIEANGVQRDGRKTSATNLITPLGSSAYTWQSVDRTLDGAALPDTAVVTLTRVTAKKQTLPK